MLNKDHKCVHKCDWMAGINWDPQCVGFPHESFTDIIPLPITVSELIGG